MHHQQTMGDAVLAFRNLFRNRRRTLVALGTLVFSVVAMVLAGGFIEWLLWAMRESTIESRLGHIQVVRSGYFQAGAADPYSHLLDADTPVERAIARAPHVTALAPRLHFAGLVSLGDHTVSFVGEGIDPGGEKDLSRQLHVEEGRNLSPDDPNGVILGVGLARNIGAVVGDRIVVLATTANGSVNATEVVIRGLFYTSAKAFDDTVLRMPIEAARQLLRTSGSHAWVLLLDDTEHAPSVLAKLAEQFPEDQTGLEFVPWYDLADYYNKTVRLFSRQMLVIELIVAVIVILTISNAAAMNILERTAEIGTLMALGIRRGKILRLFLYEGLALGVLGGAAGVALGWALSVGISAIGIPMPPSPGMDVAFDAEILVNGQIAANGFIMAVAAATVATIFPAWRASRLAIVDALRRGR